MMAERIPPHLLEGDLESTSSYRLLTMIPTTAARRAGCVTVVVWYSVSMVLNADEPATSRPTALRFEVRLGDGAIASPGGEGPPSWPRAGRLIVVLSHPGTQEPRLAVGQ